MRIHAGFTSALLLLTGLVLHPQRDDAQSSVGYFPIPTRAFVIEGGFIGLQSGVMRNPKVEPAAEGDARYPVRYFLMTRNETQAPVVLGVEWQFPGEEWKKGGQTGILPGKDMAFWQDKLGLLADTAINVRVTVWAAKTPLTVIGSEETLLRFSSAERDAFLSVVFAQGKSTMMTGWPEMGHPASEIPGTQAGAELQNDIQLLLWKEESKQHRDCRHETVVVTPARLDSSAVIADMLAAGGDPAKAARKLVQQASNPNKSGVVRLERWVMKSCDSVSTYEVLLAPAKRGGTDIIVHTAARDTTTHRP